MTSIETTRLPRRRTIDMRAARALGTHTPSQWYAKCRAMKWRCAYCDRYCEWWMLEKDHIVPVSRGRVGWWDRQSRRRLLLVQSGQAR